MMLTPNTILHSLGKFSGTSAVIMKRKIIQTSNHKMLTELILPYIQFLSNFYLSNTHYNTNKVNGQGKGNNTDNSQRTNNVYL